MATKTKSTQPALTLGCKFGNLNVGDETCRIGVRIDRSKITLTKAHDYLCGHRLTVLLVVEPGNPDTATIPGAESPLEVKGSFDCKSFNVKTKSITFGLTGSMTDLAEVMDSLYKFAKRDGRVEITGVAALPDSGGEEDEE